MRGSVVLVTVLALSPMRSITPPEPVTRASPCWASAATSPNAAMARRASAAASWVVLRVAPACWTSAGRLVRAGSNWVRRVLSVVSASWFMLPAAAPTWASAWVSAAWLPGPSAWLMLSTALSTLSISALAWSVSWPSALGLRGMRGGPLGPAGGGALEAPSSSSWMKDRPVTPWNASVAKVDWVMGAAGLTATVTSTLPRAAGSKAMSVTLPTATPLKRTGACTCRPVTASLLVIS